MAQPGREARMASVTAAAAVMTVAARPRRVLFQMAMATRREPLRRRKARAATTESSGERPSRATKIGASESTQLT